MKPPEARSKACHTKTRRVARTVACWCLVALAIAGPAAPSSGQADDQRPGLEVRPVRPWFGPDVNLQLEISVSNPRREILDDMRVSVALFRRVRSRSELEQALDSRLPSSPLEASSHRLPDIEPGARISIVIEEDLASRAAFDRAPDGVYPLVVSVGRPGASPVAQTVSAVAKVTEPPQTPLRVLVVASVSPAPLLRGQDREPALAARQLESLRRRLEVPGDERPIGAAISPLLLEEVAFLGGAAPEEAEAVMGELRRLADGERLLSSPFTPVRLTDSADVEVSIADELREGTDTSIRILGAEPQRLVVPPGLVLDGSSVEQLRRTGVQAAVVDSSLLPGDGLTTTGALSDGALTLIAADGSVGRRISAARSGSDAGRALAEVAMVFFESPGRSRTLTIVADALSPQTAWFVEALAAAPWVELVSPQDATSRAVRTTSLPELARAAPPPESYLRALAEARADVRTMSSFFVPPNPLLSRLQLAIRGAAGTASWEGRWARGREYAAELSDVADGERRDVTTAPSGPVTFTSRQGEVPVTVVNRTGFPVRVMVEVESGKLLFPEGNRIVLDPLPPRGATVTFSALAEATGTFPLKITLRTADGESLLAQSDLVVRSTAANVLAVAMTLGAAAFFVVWYGRRFLSGRRASA